ncbi:MAG: protein-glutamate O-methyltransferase CheR [Hungatella sp.]
MMTLSEKDFIRLATFIHQNYGINLFKKKSLIEGRLNTTLASSGFTDFTSYVNHILTSKNADDMENILNKLTTNYTYFMREPAHFDYFRDTILPELVATKKDRVMSIWSAGCSSGEEPYTLSMIIKEFLGAQASSWDTRVLATDISQNVLATASNALYPESSLSNLPATWKQKYFVKSGDRYLVAPVVKSNVLFRTFNLMTPIQFRIKFDVIFCRNVMIYFDQDTKDALINRFYNATNPGGYLLIGHSESINKEKASYKYIMPATYRKA